MTRSSSIRDCHQRPTRKSEKSQGWKRTELPLKEVVPWEASVTWPPPLRENSVLLPSAPGYFTSAQTWAWQEGVPVVETQMLCSSLSLTPGFHCSSRTLLDNHSMPSNLPPKDPVRTSSMGEDMSSPMAEEVEQAAPIIGTVGSQAQSKNTCYPSA